MARRRRAPLTPEQREAAEQRRAAQLDALHAKLTDGVLALQAGPAWQAWLTTASKFHHYSLNNQLLIWAQRPSATLVAGYGDWQSHGRQVRKGEKSIRILAPIKKKVTPDDPAQVPETDEQPKMRLVGFKAVPVFDLSQTDGDPLPEQPMPELLDGQAPAGLWEALAAEVEARGFTVTRSPDAASLDGANGVTNFATKTVTVRGDVAPAQAVKTLAHELGHVLLHDPAQDGRPDCQGIVEVEAESVAFVTAAAHGLDTSDFSFAYVAGWASAADDPQAALRVTAQRVHDASAQILNAVSPETLTDEQQASVAATATAASVEHGHTARAQQTHQKAQQLAQEWSQPASGQAPPTPQRLLALLAAANTFYRDCAADDPVIGQVIAERGIDPDVARNHFSVGYAPAGWTSTVEHLREAGFSDTEMIEAGVAQRARTGTLIDTLRDRITFPYRDDAGQVIGFSGRAVNPTERTPKYLNTKTTALFEKGERLLGLDQIGAQTRNVVVVEGPWDAASITYASNGRAVGVAPAGTSFTASQAAAVAATGKTITVWMDGDTAGQQAAVKAHATLTGAGVSDARHCSVMGMDPNEALQTVGSGEVNTTITQRHQPLAQAVVDDRLNKLGSNPSIEAVLSALRSAGADIAHSTTATKAQIASTVAARHGLSSVDVASALTQGAPMPGRHSGATTGPQAPPQQPTMTTTSTGVRR